MKERWNGYKLAMQNAGLKPEAQVVTESEADTLLALRSLLGKSRPPTACFCSNNFTMRNTLHALSKMNIAIPDQLAVVGFDDFEMADIVKPAITVVRQPAETMGRVAAELLFAQICEGSRKNKSRHIVLPVELVIRQSCGFHHQTP